MVHNTPSRSGTRLRGEGGTQLSPTAQRRPEQRAWRLAGLGIELAGAIGGFCLLGYWIDRHYGTHPWGLLIGAICGLIGGFTNFIRSTLKALTPPGDPGSEAGDDSNH